jgi:hypothetical protein
MSNTGSYYFQLPEIIENDRCRIYVSVFNLSIPYSFYNINQNNNILYYQVLGVPSGISTLTIPYGNYTAYNLVKYIQENLQNGLTISYSNITHKVSFTHTTNNFKLLVTGSSILEVLGFTNNMVYNSTSYSLVSPYVLNLNTNNCICIMTNIETPNITSCALNNRKVLLSIPVNCNPNEYISWNNNGSLYRINTYSNILDYLEIMIVNQHHQLLDLNNVPFIITLDCISVLELEG